MTPQERRRTDDAARRELVERHRAERGVVRRRFLIAGDIVCEGAAGDVLETLQRLFGGSGVELKELNVYLCREVGA